MQVEQKPPDIRNNISKIDDRFADFIERSMSKEPDDRISDWDEIRDILKPVVNHFDLALDPDELAVIIRFRDTSYRQSASVINAMQKFLQDNKINHEIEMHRGDNADED